MHVNDQPKRKTNVWTFLPIPLNRKIKLHTGLLSQTPDDTPIPIREAGPVLQEYNDRQRQESQELPMIQEQIILNRNKQTYNNGMITTDLLR